MRRDAWAGMLLWWSCQSPVAHSCSLLNHPDSYHGGMFKLNAKFDADSLLYSPSHFECHGHTVHMLTHWHLLSSLTSTVKSSLFTHVHSSPLSSAARLHGCHINHSHYINNGWTFSVHILYINLLKALRQSQEKIWLPCYIPKVFEYGSIYFSGDLEINLFILW